MFLRYIWRQICAFLFTKHIRTHFIWTFSWFYNFAFCAVFMFLLNSSPISPICYFLFSVQYSFKKSYMNSVYLIFTITYLWVSYACISICSYKQDFIRLCKMCEKCMYDMCIVCVCAWLLVVHVFVRTLCVHQFYECVSLCVFVM